MLQWAGVHGGVTQVLSSALHSTSPQRSTGMQCERVMCHRTLHGQVALAGVRMKIMQAGCTAGGYCCSVAPRYVQ